MGGELCGRRGRRLVALRTQGDKFVVRERERLAVAWAARMTEPDEGGGEEDGDDAGVGGRSGGDGGGGRGGGGEGGGGSEGGE